MTDKKNSDPTTRTYWKGRFITGWYKSPQKQEVPKLKRDFWSSATQFEDLLQNYAIWQFYEFTLDSWDFEISMTEYCIFYEKKKTHVYTLVSLNWRNSSSVLFEVKGAQ